MHREISHADQTFSQQSRLSLYLLTGVLGFLVCLDLWPVVADWFNAQGFELPSWPRELFGSRFGRYALIAAILGGVRIVYGVVDSLAEGKIGADLAMAIACIAAILTGESLVAAEIAFIGLLGECLEDYTFNRTQRAVRALVEVTPRRCWLLRDGQEIRVFTHEVAVGDTVVVKPGGRMPVDGTVVDGRSAVDVSALTGESFPLEKGVGDEVLAGSLNQFGALTIEARRVAEQTVVGQVVELTARALKDKAPLERTADRFARYFLPAVLSLAALTFLVCLLYHGTGLFRPADAVRLSLGQAIRLSMIPTLSVLVVACPCALLLATPAAVIAALGRLAGTGVLIKGGSALERLAQINAIAFDKTGTLTEGQLELGDVLGLNGVSAEELLRTAAIAEQRSEHPLALLILKEARSRGWSLEEMQDFQAHPGAGVSVQSSAGRIVAGTRRLLEEQKIPLSPAAVELLNQLDRTGQTGLLVARGERILGVLGARDRVRPESIALLAELRQLGITDIALLTGDRAAVAQTVAAELGITEVHAELLPAQKAEFLAGWRTAPGGPRRIAMVGDGINDAPALASADVGLAIGNANDVAAEAGDIVFLGDPLRPLPLLLRLARETVRIIRQNILIFAFGVNAAGILLTAWLWPLLAPPAWYEWGPVAAVIYHQLGSVAVLLNAMRLLGFERNAGSKSWRWAKQQANTLDHWIDHLDADAAFHWMGHHFRSLIAGVGVLVLIAYLLSGFVQINADEIGLVRHFGLLKEYDLEPGLHWCWPWPVEEVVRVQPDRIQTVAIGFRPLGAANALPGASSWSNPHGDDGIERRPDEAVMLTGDGNLIEMQATLRYAIQTPRRYLFAARDPVGILRSAAEAVLRETIASHAFADLLTADRDELQRDVLRRLTDRLEQLGAYDLGVRLDGLALHELHPPQEVVQVYHEVTKAMEARDRRINQAQAEAMERERAAESEALRIEREAESAKVEKIAQAEAGQVAFLARQEVRGHLSFSHEMRLFLDAVGALAGDREPPAAFHEYQRQRQDAKAKQRSLTDFRLFWTTLGLALSKRDKILIDAGEVPGRRQLLLFDPELLRSPGLLTNPPDEIGRSKKP